MGLFKKKTDILAEKGNELFDQENYKQAIEVWKDALNLLKEPLNQQSEAVWFQTSIADAYFLLGEYEKAYGYLYDAKSNLSGDGYANPFVMLRLGQCSYELGREDYSEYLIRAYMLAGREIFENDDDKYYEAIKTFEDLYSLQLYRYVYKRHHLTSDSTSKTIDRSSLGVLLSACIVALFTTQKSVYRQEAGSDCSAPECMSDKTLSAGL